AARRPHWCTTPRARPTGRRRGPRGGRDRCGPWRASVSVGAGVRGGLRQVTRSSAVEMRTSDVAAATGGRLVGPDVTVRGAAIDSRLVAGGELFVPVVAARDGHDFVR